MALGASFTSPWTGIRIAGINVADYLLVAATVSTLLIAIRQGRKLPIFLWAALPPLTLLVIAAVNTIVRGHSLWSERMADEWVVGSAVGAGYGGAVPLVLRMALAITAVAAIVVGAAAVAGNGRVIVERIIRAWAIGAAVSAVYGVLSLSLLGNRSPLSGTPFLYQFISESRATGLASHPNSFGQTVAVALPVLIYMIGGTSGIRRMAMVALVAVSGYAIVLSGSRADIVLGFGLAAATVSWLALSRKRLLPWVPFALAALLPLLLLTMPAFTNFTRFSNESGHLSTRERSTSLEIGFDLFGTNPVFGAGVGSWGAEMVPLIVLTSGGIVYFALFYGSLARPICWRSRLPRTTFVQMLTISALAVLAFGLVNNAIVERYLYWPFAALFALSLINTGSTTAGSTTQRRGREGA
jgi:hypothetical protein